MPANHMDESVTGWVLGGVATVVATLAAAVGTLWKMNETKNARAITRLEKRSDECESDRAELRLLIVRMEARMGNDATG